MPPKGSGKRKRAEPAKVDFTSLPKDLTPPPNFVLEKAGEDFPVKAGSANVVNPDKNPEILDAKSALRASPDADEITHEGEKMTEEFEVGKVSGTGDEQIKADDEKEKEEPVSKSKTKGRGRAGKTKEPVVKVSDKAIEDQVKREDSPLSSIGEDQQPPTKKSRKAPTKASKAAKKGSDEIKAFVAAQAAERRAVKKEDNTDGEEAGGTREDPDGDDTPKDDAETVKLEARRPPPIHSDYLPLPWKGRLGYACLNTYLRFSNPPVFASRTCRIASILDHRHPLADPTQPEHPTKNRPDKTQPASIERGRKYVESLGVANARDVIKMIRWNAKYGIRFMRLSSEMFPFASHDEYGYTLEPFAKEVLGEVGKVAGELNCRLTTHPGQVSFHVEPR
jgi:UV DNA damage endonuclease